MCVAVGIYVVLYNLGCITTSDGRTGINKCLTIELISFTSGDKMNRLFEMHVSACAKQKQTSSFGVDFLAGRVNVNFQ